MADLLSDRDLSDRLEGSRATGWKEAGGLARLTKSFEEWKFDDVAAPLELVNRVAEVAEDANPHPDILLHG